MKKLILSLFVLTSTLFAISVQAQVAPEQARNYQINAAHTGAINVSGVQPPLKQKWSRNFGQPMSYPLVVDGKVFVTVRYATVFGTELYALNAADGATLWSYPLGGSANWSATCYENGRVFALNNSGLLRAFDGDTGNVIWSRQLFGQNFTSAPTVFQGVIYIGGSASVTTSGKAHAVSAETGDVLWSKTVGEGSTTAAVTTDGVYLSYSCIDFSRLNPADGSIIWRNYGACGSGTGRAPAIYNGRAYVRTPSFSLDQIYYSPEGGYAGDFTAKSAPAFLGNTGFFLVGNRFGPPPGVLEAHDLTTNEVLWYFMGEGLLQSAILVVNDYVYIGSGTGKLYALKASNGEEVWSTTAGTSIPDIDEQTNTQPMTGLAAGDGILVVPTSTTLVAYETDNSPTITWDSPTPAPNSLGWHNTSVQLPFTAVSRIPGLAFATPESPLQFNTEGVNQTQQVTVIDEFGNTATLTSPSLKIDLTAPVTNSAVAGTVGPGVTQWYRDSAQVTLTRTDNLSGIQLTSYSIDGVTQGYLSPFTIRTDGSHTFNYWSSDRAGNIETQHSRVINVDVNAPVTQISAGNGYYASPTEVTLTATDSGSGVANTFYQYHFGPTQTYSGPFMASGDGNTSIVFWSTDWAGHVENQRFFTLKLDGSAPSTAITIGGTTGSNGWRTTPVQITLSPTDAFSGVAATYYTVDGGPTQPYSGPFTVDGNAVHQVNYWSVDNVGNTEVQKSTAVKIDKEAPTTESSLSGTLGNNDYYTGSVQVTLTGSDSVSGLGSTLYSIDNFNTTAYPGSPITVSGNGTHTVSFWSKDAAGNNESTKTITIKIDASVPVTQATLAGTQGNGGWYTNEAQVTLSATDTASGVENTFYKIDGGSPQTYSAPFTISNSGYHSFFYWSVDRAGNTESQRSMQILVDSAAPTSQASAASTSWLDVWYLSPARVSINATDNTSGTANTYYTIDGGPIQTYAGMSFNISAGGVHVVNYWSVDLAGNTETQKAFTVRVDSDAPTTQIMTGGTGANGWYRGPVQVGLTATDPEVGVSFTFYRVDGGFTTIYGGAPFTVSGEGQHTVLYWSNDKLTHVEAQNSATIKIDSTLPTVQSSFSGPLGGNGYYKGPVQFTMTGADSLSGLANIYYRVNGGAPLVYSSPFTIGVDGNHSVDYWSVDVAGNASGVGNAIVKIDMSALLTQATGSGTAGTNGWYRSGVQVSLAATDNLSGVQTTFYKVDGGTTKIYSTAFSVSGNGSHTVNFWSVDKATNTETMGSFAVNIDTGQPGVTCNVVPSTAAPSSNPVTITVTGRATDTVSGVSITDGATFNVVDEYGVTQPTGPITLQSNGNYSFTLTLPATKNVGDSTHVYTVTVRGTDRAGNTNTASDTLKIN